MRGTLHIVPKNDLDVFAGARRRVSTDRETQWMKYVGISYTDLEAVTHAIRDALAGRALTKSELLKNWQAPETQTRMLPQGTFDTQVVQNRVDSTRSSTGVRRVLAGTPKLNLP